MRTSIATVSLSGSLTEKLAAVSRAGFDGVEIFENDLLASPLAPEEVRARCADLGLSIDLYQPMRDIEAVPTEVFAENLRRARHKFELMGRLGCDTVLVCSSVHPLAEDDDALAAYHMRQLALLAEEFGIRVAYEALAWGRHVNTYDHAWRIVEAADHPALGTCLDSFHILARGSDPKGIEDIPGEKIFFLQLADAPLMAMDVLQWSRHYRCFPGQGGLDVTGLVGHVRAAGYDGPLSLEVFNDVFRQAEAGPTAVDAHRSLLMLQEAAGIATLPKRVVPTGVAFAELVTPDAEPVAALLGALGFARTARHRGKPVDLWQQGEARVLVNTGPAARRDGTQLAAIGLESPDPAGAARRAEALLAPVLPRRRTAEDAPLDAVAAPDGTELFFCATDRPGLPSWTGDFRPVAHPDAAGHVHRVDHLALTQPWHQFDEAALFHRTVLGLHASDSVDVADPYGLFRSRPVTNDDGSVRIALSVGPAPTDDTARAQHIALATDDIVAAARAFRAAGGRLLAVPANYHDDLAARFAFADGELETYRELGILYDRDAGGAFRHCYTETVGRVFFELVQRDAGYQGYGAQNAPVRLAAQHVRRPVG
ncbi:sugar phosphate isomerase/epimerase and 4-hydroxyphenylpyruvate domain-containing protein [Streptomyces caniscabiei]|uniref:3-dehydroshikimate dehydratase n=1 Tax=Streptomyces caniscabiei TaxID=2746961 RepID=A0ABU4MPV7_9ACTN|nr:sugar phosphate isomerase/epimerase and 4-hydroxyphenylpyruvate domain-containing protein [Streptomyces caniscabiei]MBE4738656.1 sugar phosphate isomerase/epimerase and 4-hydroxyphenylpyruvate domain-containing protein [Streptomyces caniscabiei]MBE4756547.1 sugar phosphate isomerase/epimerase and 4-hydroxyphenylpyruvate domain-containing protein [Streptomyces caniscabiei]MBE4768948.1 sugar phosphate isomerase/epimerase and 4-hydroxyphenylpyruvate domain-containing protein [Streptomyces canisc